MESIFTSILSTSISAGFMVLDVAAIRILFRKMPKSFRCFLWMLVGIHLLFPFSIESAFGLLPRVEIRGGADRGGWLYDSEALENSDNIESGTGTEDLVDMEKKALAQPGLFGVNSTGSLKDAGRGHMLMKAGAVFWGLGVLLLLGYFFISWHKITRMLKTAVPWESMGIKIYQSDRIQTPFLFGIVRPRIYIPMHIEEESLPYIIKHECAHQKRKDYLTKPAAFVLLCIHWFNPCIWLAYKLMCRDIELACDELVIRDFTAWEKKAYSTALLNCSVSQKKITACQAFFGETGIKERVKNVLRYKKPALLAVVMSITVCMVVSLCFMTTRREKALPGPEEGADQGEMLSETEKGDRQGVLLPESEKEEDQGQTPLGSGEEAGQSQTLPGSGEMAGQGQTLPEPAKGTEDEAQIFVSQTEGENPEENTEFVRQWTEAFCNRDGEKIYAMCSDEWKKNAGENEMMPGPENGYTFGWSSPWPIEDDLVRVVELSENHAELLYYAWTSDPHMSVWRQSLSYHKEDKWLVDQVDTDIMEYICILEEFEKAYPDGEISGTPMDYLENGMGEALNNNALLSSTTIYLPLFEPDTAAVSLLNLLRNEEKVEVEAQIDEKGKEAKVTVEFMDGNRAVVLMVQPYGENGIWIPQSYNEEEEE